MTLYEVSNNLSTSLVIEDIGVTLQARGGVDSSKVITDNMHGMSSDIRKMVQLKWVTVSLRQASARRPMSIWPLSGLAHQPSRPPTPEPAVKAVPALPSGPDISSITSCVARLDDAMVEVLRFLRFGAAHGVGPSAPGAPMIPQDPIFLPSRMVPEAEVRMTVSSSETEASSFDESKEALAKLRQKK